ncbi:MULTISPECIES: hypothetical protein [unclassified Streptomyces]|uniref:hypothetical protein n=1 Tax=unclassified Streptomyces TaxID=2593676 RepID=UPI002DDBEF1A|nr:MULTISPECIES: hypothetical protein [unclassified Streptomyces]WSC37435.1 hypothetical protein OHA08_19025 [Streptomyces sp. NBC_01763]WSC55460.1 hypothetical protein OG808_26165 [Streptomyces sp. NBC_01761]WSF86295.1 hypothetical protein OIE70_26260 [Streptomyces sp. NBC_01744]
MRLLARIAATALRTATATLCAVTALALTACNPVFAQQQDTAPFARLTGPEVVNKALAATRAAKSVRITVETKSPDGTPVEAYVATDIRGECTVTLSMGAAGTMDLVRTGGTVYTQSDEAMLRAVSAGRPPAEVKKLTGRWVKADHAERFTAQTLGYCDRKGFLDRLAENSSTAHKGRATAAGSTPALSLTGRAGRGTWQAAVAAEGRPHLLKLRFSTGTPLAVEFTEFDKPFTVERPAT